LRCIGVRALLVAAAEPGGGKVESHFALAGGLEQVRGPRWSARQPRT
jgi:hypothetical protein